MRTAPRPEAVLFDMDGVLVRSEDIWFRAVEAAAQRFGTRPVTRAEFAPTFGQGTAADIASFGWDCTVEALDAHYTSSFLEHLADVWVDPDAAACLEALRAEGLPVAVVTNTVSRLARALLAHVGLAGRFACVVCADEVPRAKPAPDLLLSACAQLGVGAAQAWMVGDSRFDGEAALAAGVWFVGFRRAGNERADSLLEVAERVCAARRR